MSISRISYMKLAVPLGIMDIWRCDLTKLPNSSVWRRKLWIVTTQKWSSEAFHVEWSLKRSHQDQAGCPDTSQIYLIFQILCSIICSGISQYLNKTAEWRGFYSFCLFSQEIKWRKISHKIFTEIRILGFGTSREEPRGSSEYWPRHATQARLALRPRLASSFRVPPYVLLNYILPGGRT
jgi:hypothetical protein